ncbi:crotonase/enoyl-CoA hydratase family protein [Alicyclobacillus sp.]|uniref:crotonase/enoyl-CoA hydratase family protein n=1 Tax=Alicyclobacillus sp. TaxID=61169 RepID=UPI0025B7AF7B|nr:crotonase/enoyl-CoA hydratase family protein [Alicyclobacillus sp.]
MEMERKGRVCTVILNRPEVRNAIDRDTARALADAFRAFEADDALDVAVLWGAGGHFCAGADLKALAAGRGNDLNVDMTRDGPLGPTRMALSKPVIAAVSGYAVAGGLELALWCDLRVVERTAVFGVFCRRFGVPLIDGGTQRLPRLIGMSRAMDLILTGRPVGAKEAYDIGLANRLVEPGQARMEAERLAEALAAFPQGCLRSDRLAVYAGLGQDLAEGMRREFQFGARVLAGEDALAGAARFCDGEGRHGQGMAGTGGGRT